MEPTYSHTYVLKLSNNKYYVGASNNPEARAEEHASKTRSCPWVSDNLPIRLVFVYENKSKYDEDIRTKELMSKYGIDNVRGGSYTTKVLPNEVHALLSKELATSNNQCFNCGSKEHYAKECKKTPIVAAPVKKKVSAPKPVASTPKTPKTERKCSRCRRTGHTANKCYAKTTFAGDPL